MNCAAPSSSQGRGAMQPNSKPEDFAEGLLSASEGLAGAGAREQGHRGTARAESSLGALFSRRVNRDASLDGGPGEWCSPGWLPASSALLGRHHRGLWQGSLPRKQYCMLSGRFWS